MGRTKLFTDQEVMDSVADVFATHGYGGTSISMLTDATGLGKQSLYNSFGDKQSLYLKAIDCSAARYARVTRAMDGAPNGFAAIQRFFDSLLQACASADPAEHSCIVSAGLLEGIDDDAINQTLCSKWAASHNMLLAAIKRGQADGSITAKDPPTELADYLMTLTSGLRVTRRAVHQLARLRKTVQRGLAILSESEVRPSAK
jgi:TetR/AcrR family transcriptional regulator, transcriptional repressor for nem operon